jgi:hypothetical protein
VKRSPKRELAQPIPPLCSSQINANVELTPPTQDPADVQAQVTQISALEAQRYVRWADKVMESHKQGNVVSIAAAASNRDETNMNGKLKIAKAEPLTFQCIRCDQQFKASGKPLERVASEVSDHIRREHPDLSKSDLQQAA